LTEVPEHLLRRSRERREALGLSSGGGDAGAAPAPEPADAGAVEKAEAPAAAAPAAAPVAAEPPPPPPPEPLPPYVEAAQRRKRIPVWVAPVLVALPLWAVIYAGSLGVHEGETDPVLAEGGQIYAAQCAACHGPQGQGLGNFPQLSGGEVLLTFPDRSEQVEWVRLGSVGWGIGEPYGDPDREGGQRTADPGMPGFENTLDDEQLLAVVRYTREVLNDEETDETAHDDAGDTERPTAGAGDPDDTAEGDPAAEAEAEGGEGGRGPVGGGVEPGDADDAGNGNGNGS
jgi:mono/diheme cytochrome c family protein